MSSLTLNLENGSVSFRFTLDAATELKAALTELMNRLKLAVNKTAPASRPTPQPPIEYRYTGDVFLEFFCNPNLWATPFAAKVLITLRDDRIRLSTEVDLTRLIEDVNLYLEQN